jgi:hypothetical protein
MTIGTSAALGSVLAVLESSSPTWAWASAPARSHRRRACSSAAPPCGWSTGPAPTPRRPRRGTSCLAQRARAAGPLAHRHRLHADPPGRDRRPRGPDLWAEEPEFRVAYDQLLASEADFGGPVVGDYAGLRDAIVEALERDYRDGRSRFTEWSEAHDAQMGVWVLFILSTLTAAVLMIIWAYKVSQSAERLRPHGRSWGPGWAIGGWFIPLASLVIPKLVLNEAERIATAPRSGNQVVAEWRRQSTSILGWAWWLTYVAASLIGASGVFFQGRRRCPDRPRPPPTFALRTPFPHSAWLAMWSQGCSGRSSCAG